MNPQAGGGSSSSANERKRLFITHVDAFGPYLKISGHLNPDAVSIVRSQLQQLLSTCFAIDPSWLAARQQALLRPGSICLYKRMNGAAPADCEFVRTRVGNVIQGGTVLLAGGLQVEVELIDYGYSTLVSSYELLFPQHPELLQNIPPLCTQYIALGICTDWKKSELDDILRMIIYQTLDICIEMEFNQFKFITMKWKEFNFAEFLIHQKKIGAPIANSLLRDNFIKILKQQQQLYSSNSSMLINNNTVHTNNNYNNNNINYYNHNNNAMITSTPATGAVMYPAMGVGVVGAGAVTYVDANQSPSLAARLQQEQQQLAMQGMSAQTVRARMPHAVGNMRTMMQGIQVQNTRIPYTGVDYYQASTLNGATTVTLPTTTAHLSIYNARQQRPQPPQPLGGLPQQQQQPSRSTNTATFKSNNLTVGNVYDVCVSFVENGPHLFSVQLVNSQNELTEMMNQIEKMHLKQFTEKPMLGTACIARYSEDGQLYRALITKVQPMACKVAYIDYGNAELVNFCDLYEIPEEFIGAKAFAIRFTLSGHKELEPIDESLKKAFKDLVIYKMCRMRVMPLEGPPLVQYCELYMQDKNILDVLKQIQKCRLVYAKAEPLQNNDIVEIRYIDSPKHFYVQKIANIEEFEQLMDDMFLYYNKNQVVPNHLVLGSPCIVKYENEWYRAEVMRADATAIIVRHVDFGYEQKVTKNLLSTIAEKHLKLSRQAVQCCLKGFENNELNKDLATTQFEMLAEESNRKRRTFTVKIFRIQPDGVNLVNLCTKDLNVMKKLYKLSMPFEQYLTLEKEEFNIQPHNGHHAKNEMIVSGYQKPPSSIASSSNDIASVHSTGKKGNGNILNSTTLQSDERQQHLNKTPQQKRHGGNSNNGSSAASFSTEWDKQSSASSSVDNRDSRSSSSEYKQQGGKRGQHQQQKQRLQPDNRLNVSISSSSDRRSIGSGSGQSNNKQQRNVASNHLPPRFQNMKQQDIENRRPMKQQSNSPQHQQNGGGQRSQNAPQGFSQPQRHKLGGNSGGRSSKEPTSGEDQLSSGAEQQQPDEFIPFDRAFPCQHIETPAREEITICWWISPHQFYTHLKSRTAEFERLMQRMQKFYKNKPLTQLQLKVGSHVVARYRKDNILYRARIIACNQMLRKYKVLFIDFGSQYTVSSEDIWPVEKRFADFPCMAHFCAFNGIICNVDHLLIIDRMEKYLPTGSKLTCEYIERIEDDGDLYYVNVNVNNMSLRETLKLDGLILDVSPELRLDLLAGQQIRAKISSIKDMLNFKIQIEGCEEQIKLLCSYDDVRYVKSNPDVAQKFKQLYEGKSCVVNINEVTDNKVILLRPMLPLLKEDIPAYICTYPIILETFEVRVVHIDSGYRLYAHMTSTESEIAQLLNDLYAHYQNQGTALDNFEPDQICAANSSDDNWYRARIVARAKTTHEPIEVYYIDYGNKEKVEQSKLKILDDKFYVNKSAYAVEINLPIRTTNSEQANQKQQQTKKTNDDELLLQNELKTLTLNQVATVKSIETRRNRLIADLTKEGQSLVQLLKERQLIKGRDLDYMRKLLDKEKANVFEYIEMVDLTLEDEDERDERKPIANKAKPSSPKKKKPAKEAEKSEKVFKALEKPKETVKEVKQTAETPPVKVETIQETTTAISPTPAAIVSKTVTSKPPTPTPQVEPLIDPYADMEHAVLSHCDNPTRFFVHPQDKVDELRSLQENLQIVATSLPPLMSVIKGAYCISHYSVDKQWYRAKIMDSELMVLQFIDYGNTDALTDTTDIKEMSVFPDIAPLCLPCALPIKPNGTADWVDAANAIFNDSYNKQLHYEYITRGDYVRKSYVRLFIEGVGNLADRLIADGFAKPLELVQSGENCYISHTNGLTSFYIQYEKDSKALELIEMYLADNERLERVNKFELNKIVAALFPDDELWYRAKLLREVPNEGYEVLFIDYGNTSVSPECREISQEIAKLPSLSKQCALELPEHCITWSEQAEEKFSEIAALGETTFTLELREPAVDHAIVHLLIDGRNIIEDLEPLCEHKPLELNALDMNSSFCNSTMHTSIHEGCAPLDAIISHVNSPADFYIQFSKDAIRLEDMTTSLNALGMEELTQPVLGQLCAAVFSDDGALYRARVLDVSTAASNEYRVRFVDYGNEAVSTDLRTLPQDLLQLREFAKHCQLDNADNKLGVVSALSALAAETFNALIDECQGMVKVEILETTAEYNEAAEEKPPALVQLFAANTTENLCEKLQRLLANVAESAASETKKPNTCIISHANSPSQFYIQLQANSAKMELVTKTLQKGNVEAMEPLVKIVEVGRVCSAYAAEDDCYYRVRVEKVLAAETGYEICLLDYGNTILAKQLRELPEELRAIPALALKCKLNELPNNADAMIVEEQFAALMEAHFGELFEIETDVLDAETRVHTVKLQVNYTDLADELRRAVESGTTHVEVLSPVPTLHNCSVIHVNSPSSFYIQLAADVAAVEQITDVLLDAETEFQPFTELALGAVCAAQFPEDLAFYRARIVQLLDGGDCGKCEVHYLDFGNNAVTDQFRQLPDSMLHMEGYSKHCALEKCAEMGFSGTEASAHFQTLIDSRFSETFQVELLKTTADPVICRLFYQDKNVATELQQLLKGDSAADETDDTSLQWQCRLENGADKNPSSGVSSMEGGEEATCEQ